MHKSATSWEDILRLYLFAEAFGQNCGRLGENECGASDRPAAEMNEMPVVRETVVARILAHRRDHDPIAEVQVAQRQRRKQMSACLH